MASRSSPELVDLDPSPQPPATATQNSTAGGRSEPPAMPPRPLSERAQATAILKEAFPRVEESIINAVLIASGGKVEPAFNALLGTNSLVK